MFRWIILLLSLLLLIHPATAHELRPAYLDMREVMPDQFAVVWKVPAVGQMKLAIDVRLPENCQTQGEPIRSVENSAYLERWTALCEGGLKGRTIEVAGLSATMTDVLVRLSFTDGSAEVARLKPDAPSHLIAGQQGALDVAKTYFVLGVDHILGGTDHLLFVLALIILIRNSRRLVKTVTAFTVAHSITLGGAALGYFSLPQRPVEATIALSIAFVATEIIKRDPLHPRLSEQYPWAVAFVFGLLHGFGFAGALKEIGLPQADVPLALLTFNLGVEAGQLMFIAAVLIAMLALRSAALPRSRLEPVAAYAIGIVATVWLIARVSAFFG